LPLLICFIVYGFHFGMANWPDPIYALLMEQQIVH
jgi:hypothetical protein